MDEPLKLEGIFNPRSQAPCMNQISRQRSICPASSSCPQPGPLDPGTANSYPSICELVSQNSLASRNFPQTPSPLISSSRKPSEKVVPVSLVLPPCRVGRSRSQSQFPQSSKHVIAASGALRACRYFSGRRTRRPRLRQDVGTGFAHLRARAPRRILASALSRIVAQRPGKCAKGRALPPCRVKYQG